MISNDTIDAIREKYEALRDDLDERARRLWAAAEANALGYGGLKAVATATGMSQSTIVSGQKELREPPEEGSVRRVRRPGAGRKPITETSPGIVAALDLLVEPTTRGDPMCALRWTCKSTRKLAEELTAKGHPVSHTTVGELL